MHNIKLDLPWMPAPAATSPSFLKGNFHFLKCVGQKKLWVILAPFFPGLHQIRQQILWLLRQNIFQVWPFLTISVATKTPSIRPLVEFSTLIPSFYASVCSANNWIKWFLCLKSSKSFPCLQDNVIQNACLGYKVRLWSNSLISLWLYLLQFLLLLPSFQPQDLLGVIQIPILPTEYFCTCFCLLTKKLFNEIYIWLLCSLFSKLCWEATIQYCMPSSSS